MLSSVSCPSLRIISTFSHKRQDFEKKKVTGYKMRVLIFSTHFNHHHHQQQQQ